MGRGSRRRLAFPQTPAQREDARIRGMAARVQSEAHWAQILDACATQADRDSLEATIGPILPFRVCQNRACTSGDKPIWAPVLLLREFAGAPTSRALVFLRVCHVCRERITVADVLTDETWDRIREQYERLGTTKPDRALSTLTFDALQ